jgi:hypothetical protein
VREGFDPDNPEPHNPEQAHNLDSPFSIGDNGEDDNEEQPLVSHEATEWQTRDYSQEDEGREEISPQYGSFHEERNAWSKD